ncbi:hypothetical protein Tco_0985849 [Tanacetum coccineum]
MCPLSQTAPSAVKPTTKRSHGGGDDGGGRWGGSQRRGRRVAASDLGDRIHRAMRIIFGFGQKSPSENFSGGGAVVVVAGGRKIWERERALISVPVFVAKGYAQKEGIDFEGSFAPVARLEAIHLSPRGIFINQAKYAQEILIKHGMSSCDSIGTPMAMKHLDADLSGTPVDQTKYRSMRDLRLETSQLLNGSFGLKERIPLTWDSGGDKLVSWSSKKQECTSMSSAKAEYVSLSACCAQVEKGIVALFFVGTEYQLADLFTKALPEDRFKYLVRRLGMRRLTPEELEVLENESV